MLSLLLNKNPARALSSQTEVISLWCYSSQGCHRSLGTYTHTLTHTIAKLSRDPWLPVVFAFALNPTIVLCVFWKSLTGTQMHVEYTHTLPPFIICASTDMCLFRHIALAGISFTRLLGWSLYGEVWFGCVSGVRHWLCRNRGRSAVCCRMWQLSVSGPVRIIFTGFVSYHLHCIWDTEK